MEEDNKARVGCKWTLSEDEELIKKIQDKKSYEEIAINHKRNIKGIILRVIHKVIYNEYKNNNKSIDDLSITYNIEKNLIQKEINKLEINNSIILNRNNKDNDDNKILIKNIENRLEDIEKKLDFILYIIR